MSTTFKKREKERARQEKAKSKVEERQRRKAEKAQRDLANPGEDPDIAGIVPGPQPPLE
jgi:hypothetical protein